MKLIFLFFYYFVAPLYANSKIKINIKVQDTEKLPLCHGEEEIVLGTNYRIKKTNYYSDKNLCRVSGSSLIVKILKSKNI